MKSKYTGPFNGALKESVTIKCVSNTYVQTFIENLFNEVGESHAQMC